MSALPDELWRSIFEIGVQMKSIDYTSLCCLSIVCRRFCRLAAEDSLWSHLLLSDFPSSPSDSVSGQHDWKTGTGNTNCTFSSTSNAKFKSLYKTRYEKHREQKRLARRRAVLRIESQIGEKRRKIRELELQFLEEKEKMNKVTAELLNLRRIRQASVAVNVWQPEIIWSRQKQMVQQTTVPVDVRINTLEMERTLCKQQLAGLDKTIREEKKRRSAAEEELASVNYHPLQDFRDNMGQSSGCRIRSKRLKHSSAQEN